MTKGFKGNSKRHGLNAKGISNQKSFSAPQCLPPFRTKTICVKNTDQIEYMVDLAGKIDDGHEPKNLRRDSRDLAETIISMFGDSNERMDMYDSFSSPQCPPCNCNTTVNNPAVGEAVIRDLNEKEVNALMRKLDNKGQIESNDHRGKTEKQKENAIISLWKSVPPEQKQQMLKTAISVGSEVAKASAQSKSHAYKGQQNPSVPTDLDKLSDSQIIRVVKEKGKYVGLLDKENTPRCPDKYEVWEYNDYHFIISSIDGRFLELYQSYDTRIEGDQYPRQVGPTEKLAW